MQNETNRIQAERSWFESMRGSHSFNRVKGSSSGVCAQKCAQAEQRAERFNYLVATVVLTIATIPLWIWDLKKMGVIR